MASRFHDPVLGGSIAMDPAWKIEAHSHAVDRYCFLWNRGRENARFDIDGSPIVLPPTGILCVTPGHVLTRGWMPDGLLELSFDRPFYCVELHDHEVSCNGLLFNGALGAPMLRLDAQAAACFERLLDVIVEEFLIAETAQAEMLRLLLKRFIIMCTRMARRQLVGARARELDVELIRQYSALVEKHFRTHHRVRDYASMLHRSPKTLANAFRNAGARSPREIVLERLTMEAKRLLRHTDRSVTRIGRDLGFEDPGHFSRFVKARTGLSPLEVRRSLPDPAQGFGAPLTGAALTPSTPLPRL